MRGLTIVAVALMAGPAFAQEMTVPSAPIIAGAIDGYLRPGFHALASATAGFKTAVGPLCETPNVANLDAARAAFKNSVLAYAHVEFARFGPLGRADRAERLLFWPDPKGIALKQVQVALAGKDATVLDPATLAGKSVAMQSLAAAEFLLFGMGSDDLAGSDGAFRCGYLKSVAALTGDLTATLDAEWQDDEKTGAAGLMRNPLPDGDEYRSTTEVVQKIVQALSVGNDTIRDQRLSPIIGAAEGVPKPKAALFWRSGLTMPVLAAELEGLRDFLNAAALPAALAASGHASVTSSVGFEFDTALKAIGKVTQPIDAAVADPDEFKQLNYVLFVTRSLDTLLGQNLPDALGLTTGFSLLDGD